MLDFFSMLISVGMLAVVTFFAIRFDRTRDWFERPRNPDPAPKVGDGAKLMAWGDRARRADAARRPPARFPGGR
jgi:hypothetical protein